MHILSSTLWPASFRGPDEELCKPVHRLPTVRHAWSVSFLCSFKRKHLRKTGLAHTALRDWCLAVLWLWPCWRPLASPTLPVDQGQGGLSVMAWKTSLTPT